MGIARDFITSLFFIRNKILCMPKAKNPKNTIKATPVQDAMETILDITWTIPPVVCVNLLVHTLSVIIKFSI